MISNKEELTKIFLREANVTYTDESFKQYIWCWWTNPLSKTSLRLTQAGFEFLSDKLLLEKYSSALDLGEEIWTLKRLLQLDKHMAAPFYLANKKRIVCFGEQDAIMVVLHGNSLFSYLTSLTSE